MNKEQFTSTQIHGASKGSIATEAIGQLQDEEIYCPVCNYNLTGTFSGRCPECGSMFYRQALIEAQKTNKLSLIPWDSPEPMPIVRRFWATLKISLFDPKRFAVAFSVQPQHSRASGFLLIVFSLVNLIALAFFGGAALLEHKLFGPRTIDYLLLLAGVVLYTSLTIFGSTLASAIALWVTSRHYDGKRHFKPWLSICAYSACHYLMIATVAPMCWLLMLIIHGPLAVIIFCLAVVGCGALAGFTLQAVMEHRTAKHQRSIFCALLLILIYAIGPFFTYGVTAGIIGVAYYLLP